MPAAWRTSSFSAGACVEVTPGPRAVLVRDSKDAGLGPILVLDQAGWRELLGAALERRPGAAGGLRISREQRRTRHAGSEVTTTWHVMTAGIALHYTHDEWIAFAAGAREGEFEFAPVP
jgi:Domain of unknown function (DUF397)